MRVSLYSETKNAVKKGISTILRLARRGVILAAWAVLVLSPTRPGPNGPRLP
jgi:hypothetical protein